MIYELPVRIGEEAVKVFLQENADSFSAVHSPLHNHFYIEVHIVYDGEMEFFVEGETYIISAGELIVIPAEKYHWRKAKAECSRCFAFSAIFECKRVVVRNIDKEILSCFEKELHRNSLKHNFNKISAFISLIWCYIIEDNSLNVVETTDYGYLISCFFEQNYDKNVTLSDLAQELSLSDKQTSRLVMKYTGNSFKGEIIKRRVKAAKVLLETSFMSKEEIAEYLGYSSYSCLWRAIKAYDEQNDQRG